MRFLIRLLRLLHGTHDRYSNACESWYRLEFYGLSFVGDAHGLITNALFGICGFCCVP